jgi:hypothetical protein
VTVRTKRARVRCLIISSSPKSSGPACLLSAQGVIHR